MERSKCSFCAHRLSIVESTVGRCKCDGTFCTKHKTPEKHDCTYDFHTNHKKQMQETLKQVKDPKVAAI